MRGIGLTALILSALLLGSCKRTDTAKPADPGSAEKGASAMAMTMASSAFAEGATIPKKFTCDGDDVSPALIWSGVPQNARSLVLIMDDPDAPMGTWVHWVLYGMPPSTPSLPEAVPKEMTLPGAIRQGKNSWQKVGYGGPCPPASNPHRYYFKLYALDGELDLPDGADKAAVERAMKGHILAEAQLMGRYGRQS